MSTENIYSVEFTCSDPETSVPSKYTFKVTTKPPIEVHPADFTMRVHQLARKAAKLEDLADKFRSQFPGKHSLTTVRYGVKLVARREGTGL